MKSPPLSSMQRAVTQFSQDGTSLAALLLAVHMQRQHQQQEQQHKRLWNRQRQLQQAWQQQHQRPSLQLLHL
jgi:hypothetical protein